MTVLDNPAFDDHELVTYARDPVSGLSAILAVHNTSRGPALGGCRMWPYASTHAAETDALRLARGMTYKAAISGLPFGGGKSVIIGDPAEHKTSDLLRAMGRAVDALCGRYTVAEDVGIGVADVAQMAECTTWVAGMPVGESDGDPSPATAYGVYQGMRAAVRHSLGRDELSGLRIGVQGAGAVGDKLCAHLADEDADVLVADVDAERARAVAARHGARTCPAEDILAAELDILAPCALGGVIDDVSLPRLRARIIAGAANNQLAADHHGAALRERGILYAPDYVVNAGGVIHISHEGASYDRAHAFAHVGRIHDTLLDIFARAERTGEPTSAAADRLAEARFTHPNPEAFRGP